MAKQPIIQQPDPVQMALMKQQQSRQFAQDFIMQTGGLIYANLVAGHFMQCDEAEPELLRAMAKTAKQAAPFIAEAYGLINLTIKTGPGEGDDNGNSDRG